MVQANPQKRCIYFALPMQVFMIHAIKTPLLESVRYLFSRRFKGKYKAIKQLRFAFRSMGKLPEPAIENTWHPNTHNLILIRIWAFERYPLLARFKVVRNAINFGIIIHSFDPPWRWMMETVLMDALKMEWGNYRSDIRNLKSLRDSFARSFFLCDFRAIFTRRLFNALIILHIFPPWRRMVISILKKVKEMKWEDLMYGHNAAPKWAWMEGRHEDS